MPLHPDFKQFIIQAPGMGCSNPLPGQLMPPTVEVLSQPASLTPAGLADQVYEICTSIKAYFTPNPIDIALEERNVEFVASHTNLVILKSCAGATPARFSQDVLSKLKNKETIKNVLFYPVPCWDERDHPFDFRLFSKQIQVHLPNVELIYIKHMLVLNFRLESSSIKIIKMIGHQPQDNEWELNLPNLEEFHMENHEPPVENFARAMVNCPRIQRFYAHKYWHNDKLPGLYLPNCSRFIFRRGDRTLGLRVYLPKVQELTLDGCYGLDSFEFLLEGHPAHAKWNHTSAPTNFRLSLKNAGLSRKAIGSLRNSGRVLNLKALQQKMDPGEGPDASSFQQRRHKQQAEKWGWPEDRQMDYVSKMMVLRMAPNVKEAYFLEEEADESRPLLAAGIDNWQWQEDKGDFDMRMMVKAFPEDYFGIGQDYDYIDWQRSAESLNALYEQRSRDFCTSKKNQIKHPAEKMVNKLRDETGLRALSGEMRPGPGFKTNSAFTNALHAEKGMMFMDEVKTAKQGNKKQQSEDAKLTKKSVKSTESSKNPFSGFLQKSHSQTPKKSEEFTTKRPKEPLQVYYTQPPPSLIAKHQLSKVSKENEKKSTNTSGDQKVTPQTQKPEITKKSQKPGVSWATAGFLNRKPDGKKKPSDGGKREPDNTRNATAKHSKVESAVRGNQDKKSRKRAKQQQKTSLAPFGVTASRTELRNMEWEWLYGFNTKLEKGHQLILQNTLSTFPLNKLFYQTPAGSQTLISKHSKKPSYTKSNLALIKILHESGFQFKLKKTESLQEKVPPSRKMPKTASSPALTSDVYTNYMQTIILKDLKAQANKVKRDARKLKKVQALQKENEEKEKIKQKKVKEREETKKKMSEEAKKKFEKELRAVACDCTCYCALTAGITECRCVTENGADARVNDLQKSLTDNFLRKMAEIRAFKLNGSDTSDSE